MKMNKVDLLKILCKETMRYLAIYLNVKKVLLNFLLNSFNGFVTDQLAGDILFHVYSTFIPRLS